MKKWCSFLLGWMIFFCFMLWWCLKKDSKDSDVTLNHRESSINTQIDIANKEIKLLSGFSEFERELIKQIILSDKDFCFNFTNDKRRLCKEIVSYEKTQIQSWNCNKIVLAKNYCIDYKNFLERNCDNIKNIILKKRCYFNKEYEEAILKWDKEFCKKLPKILQKKCYDDINKTWQK